MTCGLKMTPKHVKLEFLNGLPITFISHQKLYTLLLLGYSIQTCSPAAAGQQGSCVRLVV